MIRDKVPALAAMVLLLACGGDDGFSPTEETAAGGGENGEDIDEDLAGTWTLAGETVTFDHAADTFIRDVEFIAGRNTLTAEGTFDGEAITLQLVKTE